MRSKASLIPTYSLNDQTHGVTLELLRVTNAGHPGNSFPPTILSAIPGVRHSWATSEGPNFIVRAIAESAGVKMPSFMGYLARAVAILLPVLVLHWWLLVAVRG